MSEQHIHKHEPETTTEVNAILGLNGEKKFADFDLPEFLVQSLEKSGIVNPSPVQEKSLPFSLKGQDILASAQTGTGKTIAFLLPIIARMLEDPESNALILAPTRELAVQVKEAAYKLLPKPSNIKTVALIGGESITKQLSILKGLEEGAVRSPKSFDRRPSRFAGGRPRFEMPTGGNGIHKNVIFVGTPGRVKDHIDRKTINLDKVHFLVLDETDRMLDLGFKDALEEIFSYLPSEKQTLMFSATMPGKIVSMSTRYLKNPARIDIEKKAENEPKIIQEIVKYSYPQKFRVLSDLVKAKEGSFIIFTKTKMGSEDLSAKLEAEGIEVRAIHGDLSQRERDFVIRAFKTNKIRVMVATDVAARGLDIPHIQYVINYDLPQCKEDYIHRIGRTGRAGAEGNAISFVNESDTKEYRVARAYMQTQKSLDEEDEDVKAFGRDYAGKRRSGGGSRGGFGGGARRDFGGSDRGGFGSDRAPRGNFGSDRAPRSNFGSDRAPRGDFGSGRGGDFGGNGGSRGGFGGEKREGRRDFGGSSDRKEGFGGGARKEGGSFKKRRDDY